MPSPILHVLTGVGLALVALAKRPRRCRAPRRPDGGTDPKRKEKRPAETRQERHA
ncbi:MAG: hypothetical protein IJS32_04550 [Kiritimatiellae bacterium]|nr:hypothetical protein [Kiritimatiellia bacterium]